MHCTTKQYEYMDLKVFECSYFPLLKPYNQLKLQFRSSQCVYLGVSPTHKGHKCLKIKGKVFISKDGEFNEAEFPFSKLFPTILDH